MLARNWVFNPHAGGRKLSDSDKLQVRTRVDKYAARKLKGKCDRVTVRCRGALCYVDAEQRQPDGRVFVFPLCRLRHFDIDRWSIALFTFSNERYEPCIYPNGQWTGSLEEALNLGTTFLP